MFAGGAGRDTQQRFHFRAIGNSPIADALIVFAQDLRGALDLRLGAFDFQVVIAQMRSDVKGGLEEFKIFVEGSEEFVDATCQPDGLFHSDSRERSLLDTTPIARISVAREGGRVKARAQDSSESNMRRNLSQRRRDGSRSWKVSLLGTACLNMPDCGPCIPQNCIGWLIPGRIG